MRFARMLGIVAITVVAAMALIGVSSAAAKPTVLCLANEDPCAEKNIYEGPLYGFASTSSKIPTLITISGLMAYSPTVTCPSGKFATYHSKKEGEPLLGEVSVFNFGACSECAFWGEGLKYSASIEATGGGDGTLTFKNPVLRTGCSFGMCYYGTSSVTADIDGGEPAQIAVDTVMKKQPGGFGTCSSEIEYHAVYQQAFVESLYITHS